MTGLLVPLALKLGDVLNPDSNFLEVMAWHSGLESMLTLSCTVLVQVWIPALFW